MLRQVCGQLFCLGLRGSTCVLGGNPFFVERNTNPKLSCLLGLLTLLSGVTSSQIIGTKLSRKVSILGIHLSLGGLLEPPILNFLRLSGALDVLSVDVGIESSPLGLLPAKVSKRISDQRYE
jgi:hypothetical protein